jgi:hypothetical protein
MDHSQLEPARVAAKSASLWAANQRTYYQLLAPHALIDL